MVKVEIGECLETESASEPEQDEVAACAQELLAGRRCLHVRHTTGRGRGWQVPKVICPIDFWAGARCTSVQIREATICLEDKTEKLLQLVEGRVRAHRHLQTQT